MQQKGDDMQDLEKDMEKALDGAIKETARATATVRPLNASASLTEQWTRLELVERELRERIRRERLTLVHEYERRRLEISSDYEKKIGEEVSKLERARDNELAALTEEVERKVREHELLTKRMT
jgi:hypothetical protein